VGAIHALEGDLSNTETITSRDITEITGKRHDNVLKDIRNLYAKLGLHRSNFTAEWTDSNNVVRTMYALPRKLGEQLLMGYGPAIRAKVIDRLNEAGRVASPEPVVLSVPSIGVSHPVSTGVARITSPEQLTMSSVEIHKLTGKQHAHVMRDIKKMLADMGEDGSKFGGIYSDSYNRDKPCFNLPRREVDILLTGYSTPMRAAVIDRWRELEAQVAKPATVANLNDAAQLRGLLLGYTEQVMQLEHKVGIQAAKIAEDKPKADYYEHVREAKNTETIGDFAKILGFGRNKLFKWLREQKILMGDNMPQQKHIDHGHFRVLDKEHTTDKGKKITYKQTVLTGKVRLTFRNA